MTLLITLPKTTEASLREAAERRKIAPETLAAQILEEALVPDPFPTLEEVVAKIKALPRDPDNIRPATASLRELLENAPEDPDFDLVRWQEEWDRVEAEMKAIERADSIADGIDPLP